jgi:hypothetical protein
MRPRWIAISVVVHVALVWAIANSGTVWRTTPPERTLATILDVAPALLEEPVWLPAEPAPPPPGRREPFILPELPDLPPPGLELAVQPVTADRTPGFAGGVPGGRGLTPLAPAFSGDARVWSTRPLYVPEGGGRPIDMDSLVRQRLLVMAGMMDSLARLDTLSLAADRRIRNPSWVVERNGRRYGLDANGIHFGSFTLPSVLLAFLPIPQGNVDQARANQRLMEMRAEILRAAARAEAEDDFNQAVREIRRRWRQERDERRAGEQERGRPAGENRPRP